MDDRDAVTLFHMFNTLGFRGDTETIRRLQDTVFTLGLVKPSANLCSPLVTAYLNG